MSGCAVVKLGDDLFAGDLKQPRRKEAGKGAGVDRHYGDAGRCHEEDEPRGDYPPFRRRRDRDCCQGRQHDHQTNVFAACGRGAANAENCRRANL